MAKINSRSKGARGERMWRDELRAAGFTARRGQQFAGGTDSPDVICSELAGLHQEVKFVESLNLEKACKQADRDRGVKPYIIAHKKSRSCWKVTMEAHFFFALLRDGMDACKGEYHPIL